MAMEFPEEEYCIIDKDGIEVEKLDDDDDDHNDKKRVNIIGQFYLVKIRKTFVDPALKKKIEEAKIRINHLQKTKASLLKEIEQRKINGPLCYWTGPVKFGMAGYEYSHDMSRLRQALGRISPESLGEDPEEVVDPKLEMGNIKERIKKLRYELSHGNQKLVEKNRMLREIKDLQRRSDKLEEAIAHGPKYDIQRRMRYSLERIRKGLNDHELRQLKPNKNFRRRNLDHQLIVVNQEEEAIQNRIHKILHKINRQTLIYDNYVSTMEKAKEFAKSKDLGALAELSFKQVEELMDKWKNDKVFRANYERSVEKSVEKIYRRSRIG